jgi:predicted N-acetyltransferase YhbS
MIVFDRQAPDEFGAVEALLDLSFGPGRTQKTAERLREGRMPADGLALVARDQSMPWGDRLVGTLTFWHVSAGPAVPALLLGPLAVHPDYRCRRLGGALVRRGLERARGLGHRAVLLVGDAPYYAQFGFTAALCRDLVLPGPVDRARFLGVELERGALDGATGLVRPAGRPLPAEIALAA